MTVIKHTITIILLMTSLILTGCKDDGADAEVSILNEQRELLMNGGKSWVLGPAESVMKDDVDVSSQFTGFKLNLGDETYTSENTLTHVWSSSGTWTFQGNNPDVIVKDGSVEVSVSYLNNTLTLTFNAPDNLESGREKSVSGEYVFHLVSE